MRTFQDDFRIKAELLDDELNINRLSVELERYFFSRLEARKDLTDEQTAKIF